VFDLDEAFHCLQTLDVRGRKALRLCDLMWQEIHDAAGGHPPNPLTRRYLAELSERTEEVRVLRERLDDALDGREAAESMLAKTRALATHWGLDTELDRALADWRPHCRRQPRSPHRQRPNERDAELLMLRRQLSAAREAENVAVGEIQAMRARMAKAVDAEHRAFRIAEHERDRAVAAEAKCDGLRDEIGRLRSHLDF